MRCRTFARTLGALALLVASAVLVEASRAAATDDDLIEITRVDTSGHPEVIIEVTAASSATGGPLAAGDLEVLENGAVVPFVFEKVPTSGLEVVLLIDTSGSMNEGDAIGAAKQAAMGFLEVLPTDVLVGVVSFSDSPALVSPLSADRPFLNTAIGGLAGSGETALYDALAFATSLFSGGTNDRQIILLSDGGDTVSVATLEEAIAVAGEIRTSVIELVSSEANRAALQQITAAGGGTLSSADDPAALAGLYQSAASSLIGRYRLVVQSTAFGEATYTVRVATPDGVSEISAAATLPPDPATVTTATSPTSVPPTSAPVPDTAAVIGGPAGQTGLSSTALLLLGSGCLFVSLLLLALLAWPGQWRNRAPSVPFAAEERRPRSSQNAGIAAALSRRFDSLLERQNRRRGLAAELEAAAIQLRPGELMVLALSGGVVLSALLYSLIGPLGVLIGAVVTPIVARGVVKAKANRRRRAFAEQLSDVLQMLVSSLKSGFGLPQALDAVATQIAEPARSEFQRVLFEVRIGRDPTDALAAIAERMKSRDFEWVVSAMSINREVGGELALILDNVGETVRERQQLTRQVRALTAEGRLSAYVLTALPPLLVVALSFMSPGYFEPMKEAPGPFLIVLAVALLSVGWLWMRRVIREQM